MPPQAPYPVFISSHVIGGFGRGSAELGIPTANIPPEALMASAMPKGQTGIYFGLSKITGTYGTLVRHKAAAEGAPPSNEIVKSTKAIATADATVLPMVMSLGWNPFYQNKEPSAEIHIVHKFQEQFYGADIKIAVLGYIRPESNFVSVEALIEEIMNDIRIGKETLALEGYREIAADAFWES
ncbi:riboflavin kinase-domain-containing protein [Limtongia smithiae]|uniref:riboflavin kinase-domain-containing protein n=1 Tax=Limtongia smithiae TaxID=1125753 RepID=UPI0034CFB134